MLVRSCYILRFVVFPPPHINRCKVQKVLRNVRSELARKLADPSACSVFSRYNIVSLVVSSKPLNKRFCWIDESQALDLMKGKFRKLGSLIYVDFYSS